MPKNAHKSRMRKSSLPKPAKKVIPKERMSGIFPGLSIDEAYEGAKTIQTPGFRPPKTLGSLLLDANSSFRFPLSSADPQALGPLTIDAATGQTITASQDIMIKAGQLVTAADVSTLMPFFHTPGNAQESYNLPKSYVEQIRTSRLLYNLNARVGAFTDLKAFYALSKFKLVTAEPFVTEFYTQVAFNKGFNLYRFLRRASLSREKFGEAILWGSRKQDGVWPKTGKPRWVWGNFILLEPELVEIRKNIVGDPNPKYFIRPNKDFEELCKKLDSKDPEVEHLRGEISEAVMNKIRNKDLVQLDETTISSVQNLTDASATRGTPPYQRLFVTQVQEDFVRLAQMAMANRYHFPIELWTLGNLEKKVIPLPGDLDKLRELVTQAVQQPPFSIFYPQGVLNYEALGVKDKLTGFEEDYKYINEQYMVGMGVNEELVLGTSSIFGSSESSGNQAFIRDQKSKRDEWEEWMIYNFFEPLARWNNLTMVKGGMLAPILPSIEWEKSLDVKAEDEEKKTAAEQWKGGILPTEDYLTMTGKNPEEIATKLEKELGTVFDDGKRIAAPAIRKALADQAAKTGTQKPGAAEGPGAGAAAEGTPVPEEGAAGAGTPAAAATEGAESEEAAGGQGAPGEAPAAEAGETTVPSTGLI